MKMQLKEVVCTNTEDWRKEMGSIGDTRMSDNSYLQNLVQPMLRRLQEVIRERGGHHQVLIYYRQKILI